MLPPAAHQRALANAPLPTLQVRARAPLVGLQVRAFLPPHSHMGKRLQLRTGEQTRRASIPPHIYRFPTAPRPQSLNGQRKLDTVRTRLKF